MCVNSAAPCPLCVKTSHVHHHTPRFFSQQRDEERREERKRRAVHLADRFGLRDGRGAAAAQAMTRTHRAGRMALTSREMLCLIGTACLWLPLFAEVREAYTSLMMMMMMMMMILQCGLFFFCFFFPLFSLESRFDDLS